MANILGLDIGTKGIGVAVADTSVPIATPLTTVIVDGSEIEAIKQIVADKSVEKIVVGYPRNQAGDPTEQTAYSQEVARNLQLNTEIVFQDESLTSVMAENRLKASGKPYQKADIDALAATIILQDYLELHHAS